MILVSELYQTLSTFVYFIKYQWCLGGFLCQLKDCTDVSVANLKLATLATFNYGGAKFRIIHVINAIMMKLTGSEHIIPVRCE